MVDIGFIDSLKRGVRQLCSRWLYFFAMIVIPIASAFFLLGLMRNGLPLHIPAAVVDLDNTVETRQIVRNIEASAEVLITHEVESEAAAMQLIREGKIYGFYVIPKNFTRDATAGQNPEIAYYTNSTFFIPSSLLFRSLKTNTVLTSAAIVRNYLVASGSATDTQAQALLQPVPLQTNMIHNPESNYSVYLSNSFIPALLALMILLTTAYSIWHEEKMRTSPQWIAVGRGSITIALLGKLLPQTVVFSAVGIFIQSVMYGYLHFPLNCSVLQTVSTMLLFVLANQGFAVFLAGILPNLRLSLSLCSLIGVLTFSIGAFSYPLEDMYGSIAIFSYVVPARYYFLIYVDQMLNGIPLYYSRFYYAALLAFMLLPLLVARRIKRHALHPVYVP